METESEPRLTTAEERIIVHLDPDLLATLDHYIAEKAPGSSREEALCAVLREWAGRRGYLPLHQEGLRPEELNASNDD